MAGRSFSAPLAVHGGRIDQQNVHQAVVVKVENTNPVPGRFEDVTFVVGSPETFSAVKPASGAMSLKSTVAWAADGLGPLGTATWEMACIARRHVSRPTGSRPASAETAILKSRLSSVVVSFSRQGTTYHAAAGMRKIPLCGTKSRTFSGELSVLCPTYCAHC